MPSKSPTPTQPGHNDAARLGMGDLLLLAPSVKAVFCDLDGTLLDARHLLPSQALDAIRAAQASGVRFIPTTGRTVFATRQLFGDSFDALGLDYVACNGMDVVQAGAVLRHAICPHEAARALLKRVIRDPQPLGFVVYGQAEPYVLDMEADYVRAKIESLHHADVRSAAAGLEDAQISKLAIVAHRDAPLLAQQLTREFGRCFEFSACGEEWVDVAAKGHTKLEGIGMLLDAYGLRADETVAIGDSMNDRTMLEALPLSVCVSNAMPQVKRFCRYEISSNTELAVPRLLESLATARRSQGVIPASLQ